VKRLSLRILIGAVAFSALLGVYALLAGEFGRIEARVLLTSLTVSATSILAMACGVAWERAALGRVPAVGTVLAVVTCLLTIVGIWADPRSVAYFKVTVSVCLAATACAHASLLALATGAPRWSRLAGYGLACALAAAVALMVWLEADDELAWRWVGVLAVLLAAATIAVPVLHRTSGKEAQAPQSRFCPACGAEAGSPCPNCGARFHVEFR